MVRKKFTCDKNTSLESLVELLRGLEVQQLLIFCPFIIYCVYLLLFHLFFIVFNQISLYYHPFLQLQFVITIIDLHCLYYHQSCLVFYCLQKEKEKIMENKRQVQHLVQKSKSIVRLKPRNPEEKSSSHVIVKALCDFKQDQVSFRVITSHIHTAGNKYILIQGVVCKEIVVQPYFLKI